VAIFAALVTIKVKYAQYPPQKTVILFQMQEYILFALVYVKVYLRGNE